ncbi:ribonuclease H [Trifolium pratense]|uniref:Ribonuclease H n=1 Tax=Trifolium pratense TaxID=57577 RepID=A0A2K3LFI0_TRIPR|nr:ribonuclease H [Trifolium pratense]
MDVHVPERFKAVKVVDLIDENWLWNWSLLADWLPVDILSKIVTVLPPDPMAGADMRLCRGERMGLGSSMCKFCGNVEETILHVMRDCPIAMSLWIHVLRSLESWCLLGGKPPPDGWVKLNTDGSCRDDGSIGCGGVIRGSAGEWLGGFSKFIGNGNAYVAELWGI